MNSATPPDERHDAVVIALNWIVNLHRKGWLNAYSKVFKELLSEEEQKAILALGPESNEAIEVNIIDWMLAHGDIYARGEMRRINEYILSPAGPRLSAMQRDWITQVAQRPLRLYDVSDVVPGQQMTLCDALDKDLDPMVVHERTGTRTLKVGDVLGGRLMRVGDHFELSGSIYGFSMLGAQPALAALRTHALTAGQSPDASRDAGLIILRHWLQSFIEPATLPTLIDHYSGDPMKMITHYYRINDEAALVQAMASQSDVEGDRQEGWSHLMDCTDGQVRASVHIEPGKKNDQLQLQYRTQRYADAGRVWFEGLLGSNVTYIRLKVQDIADVMRKAQKKQSAQSLLPTSELDAATIGQAMHDTIHRMYANWADEPVPTLNNTTPRQAIKTKAGLERVKGLLRSYERHEAEQAQQQGRTEVSYDFLWQALGLQK